MRLALLVPDGVGVRNFLLGSFPAEAAAAGSLLVFHGVPAELVPELEAESGLEAEWHPLLPSGEGRVPTTLRNALGYAHMYWAGTEAMRRRLSRPMPPTSPGRRAMMAAARTVGRAAASPQGIALLDRWHTRLASRDPVVEHYRRLLQGSRPDVLFCTHQRPPEIVAPVLAARSLGIPTATFIFSWDNLTSKARIAAPFDHYFVWSEHMRDELLRYYPDVAPSRVCLVGTPQFDPYADPARRWTREEFFRRVGADPDRPLICYSGGDRGTCPDDQEHVRLLLELIRGGAVQGRPQVLLRPAPVDSGDRYAAVRADFPELLYAPPAWRRTAGGAWSRVVPTGADIALLANITRHCDLNINTASTMTLDFAIHDRPVVNIAFDMTAPPPLGAPLHEMYYQFEHYRPVSALGAARMVRSAGELAGAVNAYLADPTLDREGRRRLVELEVSLPLGSASARIMRALEGIVGRGAARQQELSPTWL